MNENLNLCEILKGHEGETFYSPFHGYIKFDRISNQSSLIYCVSKLGNILILEPSGVPYMTYGECMLFPSKDQRDWNKWIEEQKPKTWVQLVNSGKALDLYVGTDSIDLEHCPIGKAANALLKIHQLIDVGYGGNVSNEEWYNDLNPKYIIIEIQKRKFEAVCVRKQTYRTPMVFHTKEQAEEFLSYPENVQLLKDYFQID